MKTKQIQNGEKKKKMSALAKIEQLSENHGQN